MLYNQYSQPGSTFRPVSLPTYSNLLYYVYYSKGATPKHFSPQTIQEPCKAKNMDPSFYCFCLKPSVICAGKLMKELASKSSRIGDYRFEESSTDSTVALF